MDNVKADDPSVRHTDDDGCTGVENPNEPLKCVFSTINTVKLGTGTTARKQRNKHLWYVKQQDCELYGVRKINPHFVPVGEETMIDREKLLSEYTPEVAIHNQRVAPAMHALTKTLAKGDKYREKDELFSAEMEYNKALHVDERNVRAIFGLGLVYLARNDTENAQSVFEQLVVMEAAFNVEHKHLFNEFGIALRKHDLYDEAVQYYGRAVQLTRDDENLYYNLARVHYEKGEWEECFVNAANALRLDNDHKHAKALCDIILAMAADERLLVKHNKPKVPKNVAEQTKTLVDAIASGENLDAVKLDLAIVGEAAKL